MDHGYLGDRMVFGLKAILEMALLSHSIPSSYYDQQNFKGSRWILGYIEGDPSLDKAVIFNIFLLKAQ